MPIYAKCEVFTVITKELIKKEIDKVPNQYLSVLYKVVKSFELEERTARKTDWESFVDSCYGSIPDFQAREEQPPLQENLN